VTSYRDLLKQREELEAQIEALRQGEMEAALEQVRKIIADFELTPGQVFPPQKRTRARTTEAKPSTAKVS